MDTYLQYLKNAYNKVVDNTLQDEALRTLSEMENKNFYLSRIHELFTQLYSAERENKIKELISQIQVIKIKNKQPEKINVTKVQYIQIPCKKCQSNSDSQNQYAKQQFQNKILRTQKSLPANSTAKNSVEVQFKLKQRQKQHIHLTYKQNQQLSQQLRQLNDQHLQQIRSLTLKNESVQKQLSQQLQKITNNYQQILKSYKQLKSTLNKEMETLQNSRIKLHEQIQKNINLQLQVKECQTKIKVQHETTNRFKQQISDLKACKNILEEKLNRLQQSQKKLKEKIQIYKKETQNINEVNQKLKYIKQKNIHNELLGQHEKMHSKSLQNHNHALQHQSIQKVNSLISNLTQKQLQIKKLLKQKHSLSQELSQAKKQYFEYKNNSQRIVEQLKQSLSKIKFQYQKQLRQWRQNQNSANLQIRRQELQHKISDLAQYKEKNKALQQMNIQLNNKLLKLQHSNNMLIRNYQQVLQTHRQQKQEYESRLQQAIRVSENSGRIQRQYTKKLKIKQNQFNVMEEQLRQRIKHYQLKINQLTKQLNNYKDKQQRWVTSNQNRQKQKRAKDMQQKTYSLQLKQHELTLKAANLQHILLQTKNTSKQLLHKKQQMIAQLKTEILSKEQRIVELNVKLQNEERLRSKFEKGTKELEGKLKSEQERVISIQEKNRIDVIQLIKANDIKLQELTKKYEQYYKNLINNQQKVDKQSKFSQKLKGLLQQQNNRQSQTIQKQYNSLRSKYKILQQTHKQLIQKHTQCVAQRQQTSQALKTCQSRCNQLEKQIQKYKNNQLYIAKHYEQKLGQFKYILVQLKEELCMEFMDAIRRLKDENRALRGQVVTLVQGYAKSFAQCRSEIQHKLIFEFGQLLTKIKRNHANTIEQKLAQFQRQKQQLTISYQNKLKQKNIDMITISTQHKFLVDQYKQIQHTLTKKLRQQQSTCKKIEQKLQKCQQAEQELKQIIQRMQNKINDTEKTLLIREREVGQYERAVQELTEKMTKNQGAYKKEIADLKAKYREENQRIFNRYEREFSKIVNMNSGARNNLGYGYGNTTISTGVSTAKPRQKQSKQKDSYKQKQKGSITSISSPRNLNIYQSPSKIYSSTGYTHSIPTKGNNMQEDKLEKLKRQIQEQKRLVQQLELENNKKY